MIQEINDDTFILWNNDTPTATVVEKVNEYICFTQQNNMVEIRKEQIKELIKLLKEISK